MIYQLLGVFSHPIIISFPTPSPDSEQLAWLRMREKKIKEKKQRKKRKEKSKGNKIMESSRTPGKGLEAERF